MRCARNVGESTIARAMADDHLELERVFGRVMASLRARDAERIRRCWLELDHATEQHLRAEEELILPQFAAACPENAARLREEHRQIRTALVDLGVDLDLHSLCPSSATRFIAALRQHAAFEDAVVYPWAQNHMSEATKLSLGERVRGRLQRLAADGLRAARSRDGAEDSP